MDRQNPISVHLKKLNTIKPKVMHGLHHQSAVDERCNDRGQWGRYSYGSQASKCCNQKILWKYPCSKNRNLRY